MVFDVWDWGLLLLADFLLSCLRISYEWKRNSVKTFHKALIPKILILGAFLIISGCVLFFLFPVFGIMLSVSSIAIMLLIIFFCFAFLEFGNTCLHDRWEFFRLHKALIGAGITTAVALACFSSFMAKSTWLHNSFKTEGVIFSVVVGLFTVIGFFIAIKHLHDVHTRIGTYDEYLDRSARLIEKTHDDANKEFEKYAKDKSKWSVVRQSKYTIRMVCFTPKHGNMTSRNSQAFLYYDHVLHHTINERRVRFEIVCLDFETGIAPLRGPLKDYYDKNDNFNDFPIKEEFFPATTAPCELERFYNGFSDRFGRRHCLRGLTEAYMAMVLLERKDTQKISHKIIPRLRNELPTFHFILTRKRAIVVSPLLLPKSLEVPLLRSRLAETQETGLRKHIDMIGFETTEPHILADLNRAFDFWAGSEKTIRLKTENEAEALTLSYMVPQNNNGMQKELSNIGLLFLHGLTTAPDSTFSYHIRTLREAAYIEGVSSFEVGYRGRGLDKQNDLNFTIDTAISDVVRIIEYLTSGNGDNQIPNLSRIMIVARGLGAYFALAATMQKKDVPCELVFWQPLFYPTKVMEKRGHQEAFYQAYAKTDSHKYVELEGVRLGESFFESLPNDENRPIAFIREDTPITILATKGNKVAKWEDLEKFVNMAKDKVSQNLIIDLVPLDDEDALQDHLHNSSPEKFNIKTGELIESFITRHSGRSII